jgi:CRISPR-associated protein Cas2
MILIAYDIHNTRNRTRLSRYLEKYGRRLQFSVFEIDQHYSTQSEILEYIKSEFRPKLKNNDSILIVPILPGTDSKVIRYGRKIQKEKQYLTICA